MLSLVSRQGRSRYPTLPVNRKERRAAERTGRGSTARPEAGSRTAPDPDAQLRTPLPITRRASWQPPSKPTGRSSPLPRITRGRCTICVIAHQTGRSEMALELIERAVSCDGAVPEFHYNLGVVLEALKRLDAAAAQYREVIALNPNHANAHLNLGNILIGQNRLEEERHSAVSPSHSALAGQMPI